MAGDECLLRTLGDDFDVHDAVADAEDYDCVVLSGGDGTVASLLYELRNRSVMTCVFPSGTANLLFANLGNAPEPSAIARACRVGHTTKTDLGEIRWEDTTGVHTKGFSIMAGTGYDADIMRAAIPNKQAMGEAAYFFAALANPTPDVVHFSIDVDGAVQERDGIACLVANNAMMQGDIEIVPDCRMDDGKLDVIVLETSDAAHLIRPLLAGVIDPEGKSSGSRPWIESFEGSDVSVTISQPIAFQVDGDVMAERITHYEARSLRGVNHLVIDGMGRYKPDDDAAPLFPGTEEVMFPTL